MRFGQCDSRADKTARMLINIGAELKLRQLFIQRETLRRSSSSGKLHVQVRENFSVLIITEICGIIREILKNSKAETKKTASMASHDANYNRTIVEVCRTSRVSRAIRDVIRESENNGAQSLSFIYTDFTLIKSVCGPANVIVLQEGGRGFPWAASCGEKR